MSTKLIYALPLFAAAATIFIGSFAFAADRPILVKAATCKPSTDIADPVASELLRINLFAQHYDFSKSGPGMALIKMKSTEPLSVVMEIGVPVDFEVKEGVVTIFLPTTAEEFTQPIAFRAADLMSTMVDPKAPPVRIMVPSNEGLVELSCETSIKMPVLSRKIEEASDSKAVVQAPVEAMTAAPAVDKGKPAAK